ncbi:GNAT family N-acetyltransferase [Aggregatimonas sangjinii]|uniref:GNAT family N-acetyltransferase n=1 Tax=Aggregatimonas sangjinii TaxID=2583587 RepID=A0A5B7SNG5_9FLAO|nr:GNAT family protein [Aggregatimonas sangjinii]QCX00195.1 GNAT family N-acetyltransferase [Aggregatimonas sangjinii]
MKTVFTLEDERVRLSPLQSDSYEALWPIARQEKLVQYSPGNVASPEGLKAYVAAALKQQQQQSSIPFIIYDKVQQAYAGTTRYMHIDKKNNVLHIGATWIGKEFHGSGLNDHMKFLMLNHAFDEMGFEKVEFRIDERNIKSRKAVEKLGAILEGTLRKNVFLEDGFKRDTCCYGILKEEWAATRKEFTLPL